MASIDEEQLRLTRGDPAPWGFRIMGGRDFGQPVTVCRVVARSIAEHAGLRVGDVIAAVGDKRLVGATHQVALDTIREAANNLLLTVVRGPLQMPEPFPEDVRLIQPALAHEAPQVQPGFPFNRRESEGVWGLGGLGPVLNRGPGEADEHCQLDLPEALNPQVEAEKENRESEGEVIEEQSDSSEDDETEEPSADDSKCAYSQGSQSLTERLLEQLHRVERNRASKPQPPTTFLLAPDRPPIRQPRSRPPPPPEPPFHKLVKERMRRRKWLEEHPGEDYPFGDPGDVASGRTPTPDGVSGAFTGTPTPSEGHDTVAASDVLDNENADDLSDDGIEGDEMDSTQEQKLATPPASESTPQPSSPSPPPTPLTIEETERRLQEVTAQLEALPRLPKDLQTELQHLREKFQLIVGRLQQQLDDLRQKQAEEERIGAEEEDRRRREEDEEKRRKEKEDEERRKTEEEQTVTFTFRTPTGSRPSSAMSSRPTSSFKGPLPDFIHEMTEKLAQERPSFPLTPLPRPIILPGGRKWRNSRDAFNEDFIAETLSSQAEVLLGHTMGRQLRKDSIRFPALLGLRCDLSVRCCCCGRVNFHKYAGKLEHLEKSAVYRAVHGLDRPTSPIAERAALVPALDDCCLAAQIQSSSKPKLN